MRGWLQRVRGAPGSLRTRLILTTVGSSIVAGLISTIIVVSMAWHETSEVFDDALEEGARLALSLGASMQRSGVLDDFEQAEDSRAAARVHLYYQLIQDGDVLRRAHDAPSRPFVDPDRRSDRFYNTWVNGTLWRVYLLRDTRADSDDLSVQIGQHWNDRNELLAETIEALIWPAVILWLALGVFNWWAIRRLFSPLHAMARGIAAKSPDDLSPVPHADQAAEIQPLVESLNLVLGRLDRALSGARRFTADAAHELRTPLAAVSMKLQLMQRRHASQDDSGSLAADLSALREDVARSTALVENLLLLARLDPEHRDSLQREAIVMPALLQEVAQQCAHAARVRAVSLHVDCTLTEWRGNRHLLASALRNLVDNAIRYGHSPGQVWLRGYADGAEAVIEVADDGPGVSEEAREQLTRRFFRVLGNDAAGSGLGLSIVEHIVTLHGGSLTLAANDAASSTTAPGTGLLVRIRLPSDSLHLGAVQ